MRTESPCLLAAARAASDAWMKMDSCGAGVRGEPGGAALGGF